MLQHEHTVAYFSVSIDALSFICNDMYFSVMDDQ